MDNEPPQLFHLFKSGMPTLPSRPMCVLQNQSESNALRLAQICPCAESINRDYSQSFLEKMLKCTYSERLMDLPCVDVVQFESGFLQNLRNAIGWPKQQFVDWILRYVGEVSDVCLRFESELFGFCFGHN